MGSICSVSLNSKENSTQNVCNFKESNEHHLTSKALILGTSNSGKSTLFRQMQIINTSGFSDAERQIYKLIIADNIIGCIRLLLNKIEMAEAQMVDYEAISQFKEIAAVGDLTRSSDEESKLLSLSRELWLSPVLKELFEQYSGEIECHESKAYLLNELDVISSKNFVPTDRHILYSRMRTSGVRSLTFSYEEVPIEIIDVGGQRSERRKWIHQFENVELLLFCVAANEYDMMNQEDPSQGAMEESLQVFHSIINSIWFKSKTIMLFLNKVDLLEAKISKSKFGDYFKDFDGDPNDVNDVLSAIKGMFLACDEQKGRRIYAFYTCATNTENIEYVSKACFDTVLRKRLTDAGLD